MLDKMVRDFSMKDILDMKMDVETFLEKFNNDEAVLVDVRMPFETKVWGVKFALEIPYNELPDRLDELPKDKIIVCVCPAEYRSSMAKEYLRFKGFKASTLDDGLIGLVDRLKGGKAKDIKIK